MVVFGARPAVAPPRVGLLLPGSLADSAHFVTAFVLGLHETGYVAGETIVIEERWGEGHYERLEGLADDLVQRGVVVIAAGGPPAALAAKSATSTLPIVAVLADDPRLASLIGSFSRPAYNITGVAPFVDAALWGKRVELLHEVSPAATLVAVLVNPKDVGGPKIDEVAPSARALGIELLPLRASTDSEINEAFATAQHSHASGILVSDLPFFTVRRDLVVALATSHGLPAIYGWPEYVRAGGLMSYGSSLVDAWHQVGVYTGRILKGAKPSDLPVQQPTKLE